MPRCTFTVKQEVTLLILSLTKLFWNETTAKKLLNYFVFPCYKKFHKSVQLSYGGKFTVFTMQCILLNGTSQQ